MTIKIKNVKPMENKRCRKDFKSVDDRYKIKTTWVNKKKDIKITGKLIYADYGCDADNSPTTKQVAETQEDIPIACSRIVAKLNEIILNKATKNSEIINDDTITHIEEIFRKLKESAEQVMEWRGTTQEDRLTYFERNVLPFIKECEYKEDFSYSDLQDLRKNLLEKRLKNKNSISTLEAALAGIDGRMREAQAIFNQMRYIDPTLPDLIFDMDLGKKYNRQREQIKDYTIEQTIKLRNLIEAELEKNPILVRAAVIMMCGGTRAGEAAAVTKIRTRLVDDTMMVWILAQELNEKICNQTKTDNAYRFILLDEWGTEMVIKCNELIGDEDGIHAPLKDADLSKWVGSLLKEVGVSAEQYASIMHIPAEHVADPDGHSFRRKRANDLRNYCGFTQSELDYLLGHFDKRKKTEKENVKADENVSNWSKKLWRYDIDPARSKHPKHRPIDVGFDTEGNLIQFDAYRFKNTGSRPVELLIDVEAAEMGEGIRLKYGPKCIAETEDSSRYSEGKRKNVEIIGIIKEDERGKIEKD